MPGEEDQALILEEILEADQLSTFELLIGRLSDILPCKEHHVF
jgi:hypothetical protein